MVKSYIFYEVKPTSYFRQSTPAVLLFAGVIQHPLQPVDRYETQPFYVVLSVGCKQCHCHSWPAPVLLLVFSSTSPIIHLLVLGGFEMFTRYSPISSCKHICKEVMRSESSLQSMTMLCCWNNTFQFCLTIRPGKNVATQCVDTENRTQLLSATQSILLAFSNSLSKTGLLYLFPFR